MGEKVRSPWHDGFDLKFNHARCTVPCWARRGRGCHEFKGLQKLRWEDQLQMVGMCGGDASVGGVEAVRMRRLNEMLWEVKDALAKTPKKALHELLTLNRIFFHDRAHPNSLVHQIADGLVQGKLPACPWCKSEGGGSLQQEGTLLRCFGYAHGATQCG